MMTATAALQLQTPRYQLLLRRKEWKDSVKADLEMAVGVLQ